MTRRHAEAAAALRNRYAISGVGTSARSRASEQSVLGMAVTAARQAIDDAHLAPTDIGCILGYQESDSCSPEVLATQLGLPRCHAYELLSGGASTETLVSMAIGCLETTDVSAVLIFRSMQGRSGKRMGGGAGWTADDWASLLTAGHYLVPHGIFAAGQRVALLAQRHLYELGLGEEVLGGICRTFYEHAQRNPTALMHGRPLTMEDYLSSRYLAEPLRIHDYCVETDEANAIVVVRTSDLPSTARAATIRGLVPKLATAPAFQYNADEPTRIAGEACAPLLYANADIGAGDVDVAAIYDCFSWVVLRQLLAYDLVKPADVADFILGGELGIGGALPTNTAGGMLAEGYTHGLNNVIELVRQLRGDHGDDRQVSGAHIGLATGWAGPAVATGMVLEAM